MKVGSTFKIVACVRIKILCPGIRLWLATPLALALARRVQVDDVSSPLIYFSIILTQRSCNGNVRLRHPYHITSQNIFCQQFSLLYLVST